MIPKFEMGAGFFAGLSFVLFYWLLVCFAVMAWICWDHRDRFWNWKRLPIESKMDFCLNWGLLLFFLQGVLQRGDATYKYASHLWDSRQQAQSLVTYYLPLAVLGIAATLAWMAFHTVGGRWRWYWCLFMWTGLAAFVLIEFFVEK